jgi:anhydro-N-acetylmuramic acid kinase
LNKYTRKNNLEFDDGGKLARQGTLNDKLLEDLNRLDFYSDDKPKSLGYEFVVQTVLPMIDSYELSLKNILNTFIEHSAYQIAKVINRKRGINNKNMLITGGGAFNDYLIERISYYSSVDVIIPDKEIIDFKEALIFAFLGVLKDQNKVNCLKSVTGARKDHSSGMIFRC